MLPTARFNKLAILVSPHLFPISSKLTMSSPTPGCFSLFRRGRPAPPTPAVKEAKVDTETIQPRIPTAYEHIDPCFQCSEQLSSLKLKDEDLPPYTSSYFSEDVRDTIRLTIKDYAEKLTAISLYISDHPEHGFEEHRASKKLCDFLQDEGFKVERGYKKLDTAFRASYYNGEGKVFAFNSEYDALPGIGHACGHNLIAVSGVAAILGLRAAMKKHNIKGGVVLLGTPAEEGGVGKGILLDRGGYKDLDACMMVHPTGSDWIGKNGPTSAIVPTLAVNTIEVNFYGKTAHAGGAPWDGINALDAVNIAYGAISAMRQQLHTTDRVHGIILKGGDAPNIIPDHTAMRYYVRAQSAKGVEELNVKIKAIFDAAGKATGCKVKYETERMMYDLRNNLILSEEYAAAMGHELPVHVAIDDWSAAGGSTDFGNVTYALPAVHPHYGIPSDPGRANHTPEFRGRCRAPEAHELTYKFAGGMACVGARFLGDDKFAKEVKGWFDEHKGSISE